MKMKLLVFFVLISQFVNIAMGLSVCRGPYKLPELVDATTTTYVEGGIQKAEFTVQVVSKSRVYTTWWVMNYTIQDYVEASEDNGDYRSSVEVSGDRHVFKLKTKQTEDEESSYQTASRVNVALYITYDCNTVSIAMPLKSFIYLTNSRVKLPMTTELPRARYFVGDEGRYTIKAGFVGERKNQEDVRFMCWSNYGRRNGQLSLNDLKLNSSTTMVDDPSMGPFTETICQVPFDENEESRTVTLSAAVRIQVPKANGRDDSFYIPMLIVSEIRRPGIVTPTLLVAYPFGRALRNIGGHLVLPTEDDTEYFTCAADAEDKPNVTAARRGPNGNYNSIREDMPGIDDAIPSVSISQFTVTSPTTPLAEDEYICTATSGRQVVSQKFKIIRTTEVKVFPGSAVIGMEKGQNKRYDLLCEAKGLPKPRIKFYWSPEPASDSTTKAFLNTNEDNEINASSLFKISTWEEEGRVYGKLVVKDIDKAVQNLPDRLRDQNIDVVCFAFNDFSHDSQLIANLNQ